MECNDVRPLLDLLCDGALEANDYALVLDHLKLCNECQRECNDLAQLHLDFQDQKDKIHFPAGLMERVSEKLANEERNHHKRVLEQLPRAIPVMAIAASFALVGLLLQSRIHQTYTRPTSMQTASADTLVEDVVSANTLETVIDRNKLAERVGYELINVRLPEWSMNKSSVYKSQATMPIARFDFVRKGQSGYQHLSCYQAPKGVIRAKDGNSENLEGKHVLFGTHGKLQFALWSQNGRDYLFVTALSKPQLEEIVRGA